MNRKRMNNEWILMHLQSLLELWGDNFQKGRLELVSITLLWEYNYVLILVCLTSC